MILNTVCHYSECHLSKVLFMLSVANKPIMLCAIMLSVVMLSVVMLNVGAPSPASSSRLKADLSALVTPLVTLNIDLGVVL